MRKEKLIKINLVKGDVEHEYKMVETTGQVLKVINDFINGIVKGKSDISPMIKVGRNWKDGSLMVGLVGYNEHVLVVRNMQMAELTAEFKKAGVKFG